MKNKCVYKVVKWVMRKATFSVWVELWGLPAVQRKDVSLKSFLFFLKTFLLDMDRLGPQAITRDQDNFL